jgi:elongator complex protein 3
MDFTAKDKIWQEKHKYTPEMMALAKKILLEVREGTKVTDAIRKNPIPQGGHLGKHILVAAYMDLVKRGEWEPDPQLLSHIRMKPGRTLSGVTTVTVLTKPYPCPGKCIFCPTEVRMPKSYLIGEPGAMRGLQHQFDPFQQVKSRIEGLQAVGHPTEKIELLILGGTWSAYKRDYQEWFIRRCFEAMNGVPSQTLEAAQMINESAEHRNVGLVIETRPDHINPRELLWLRKLGVTKVQMGAQSLDDRILSLNKRGHTLQDTRQAVSLLRAAGFKIVLHWMPNLLGATIAFDHEDFAHFWDGLCPDELKIYPTQLLENAELYDYWLRGEYTPYTTEELIDLIADIKPTIPRYCRVNRIIRDIPSTLVVEGNKRTSLRQDVQAELKRRGEKCNCIRCREVRGKKVATDELKFHDLVYETDTSQEHFLSFDTPLDQLAGFLRLSLPGEHSPETGLRDLEHAAIIREVHVYGQSLPVGSDQSGAAQHIGLGTQLLKRAEEIATQGGYQRLAVISAVGTRQYYLKRGFQRGEYYLLKELGE